MLPISFDKLLLYRDRVDGEHKPITADIFLTNYCNNKCEYCRYRHDSGEFMHFDLFVRVAERLLELGVKGFILTGGGEPTINPDFDKITEYLETNKIHYGINTNFNVYKECSPDFLKVSLDAWDDETYFQKRGVHAYDTVIDNIKRYCTYRYKIRNKTVVGLQCVVSSIADVRVFYSQHSWLNVDYFSFRPLESSKTIYNSYFIKNLRQSLSALSYDDHRIIPNYKWSHVLDSASDCPANWSVISVSWDGAVMYCCHKPDDVVGSIFDEDILKKHSEWNTDYSTCDVPCRLSGPNNVLRNFPPLHSEFI